MQSPTSPIVPIENILLHSKNLSCSELSIGSRRNTLEGKRANQENQNIIISYRQLSQAYDNAQQKILDLQEQIRLNNKTIEASKQKISIYEQFTNHNLDDVLGQLKRINLNESFLHEWTDMQHQLQLLNSENSVLKQQSHQFLQLNTKLGEDLKQSYQELSDMQEDLTDKESQLEELIDYVDQIKAQINERDEHKAFLVQELQKAKETSVKFESQVESLESKRNQQKNTITQLKTENESLSQCLKENENRYQQNEIQLKKQTQELTNQLARFSSNHSTMVSQKDVEILQQTLQKVYAELSQARSENRHLKEELSQLQTHQAQQTQDMESLESKTQHLKDALDQQSQHIASKDEEMSRLQTHFDHLQIHYEQKEQELAEVKESSKKAENLEQIVEQYEQHCNQLQHELQSYGQIINQYQEAMQTVMQSLQLEVTDNMAEFSQVVEKELQRMRQQCERSTQIEQSNAVLKEKLDLATKSLQKMKKEHDKFVTSLQKDQAIWKESNSKIQQLREENSQLHQQIQQVAISAEQHHKENQDHLKAISRLEGVNQLSLHLIERTSKCLGGDYLDLLQEISEVQKLSIEKSVSKDPSAQADIRILEIRLEALVGELDSLQSLDQKRQQYVQQLEKQTTQLKHEVQRLTSEMDMKEFQQRNGDQSHRIKKLTNSSEKVQDYFLSGSNKKAQHNTLHSHASQSLMNNLSYQFKHFD